MQTSWTEYFMDLAKAVSTRSTCLRRKVGAVAVNPRHMVIGTGYNGAPSSMAHCTPETCIRVKNHIPSGEKLETCKAVHAEQNLVVLERLCGIKIMMIRMLLTFFKSILTVLSPQMNSVINT